MVSERAGIRSSLAWSSSSSSLLELLLLFRFDRLLSFFEIYTKFVIDCFSVCSKLFYPWSTLNHLCFSFESSICYITYMYSSCNSTSYIFFLLSSSLFFFWKWFFESVIALHSFFSQNKSLFSLLQLLTLSLLVSIFIFSFFLSITIITEKLHKTFLILTLPPYLEELIT